MNWDLIDPFKLYANIVDVVEYTGLLGDGWYPGPEYYKNHNINMWMYHLLDQLKDKRPPLLTKFVRFVYREQQAIMYQAVCKELLDYDVLDYKGIIIDPEENTIGKEIYYWYRMCL